MQTQTPHMGTRLNQCALMNWKKGNFNCSSSRSLHTQSREDVFNGKALWAGSCDGSVRNFSLQFAHVEVGESR